MKKKIALNTFYILGIIISVVGLKWAMQNVNYAVGGFFVATALFFLYLKINLGRELRRELKEKEEQLKAATFKDEIN